MKKSRFAFILVCAVLVLALAPSVAVAKPGVFPKAWTIVITRSQIDGVNSLDLKWPVAPKTDHYVICVYHVRDQLGNFYPIGTGLEHRIYWGSASGTATTLSLVPNETYNGDAVFTPGDTYKVLIQPTLRDNKYNAQYMTEEFVY